MQRELHRSGPTTHIAQPRTIHAFNLLGGFTITQTLLVWGKQVISSSTDCGATNVICIGGVKQGLAKDEQCRAISRLQYSRYLVI
jgi:hypothetical protein